MTYASRTATVILTGLLAIASTCGRAAGQGGGHGGSGGGHGFGGHAGHSAGRSSSAHSSGHSIGHSIGHSFAHIFGHHGQGASSVALIKAPAKPWSVTPSPISVPQALRPQPRNPFIFRHRNGFFPRRRTSGFAGCPYGWFDFHFRFDDNWNCPSDAFFFDHSSPAGLPDRFSTALHLAAQHGLKVGRRVAQRCNLQPNQTRRIRPRIRTQQTRHRSIRAAPPCHHQTV